MNQDLLRVFETESDYDSAKDSFVYPTVSYVRDVDEVHYMPKPLRNYFYIEALADNCEVGLVDTSTSGGTASANELEYSTDQQVWRRLPNNTPSSAINTGERIYLRGNATVSNATVVNSEAGPTTGMGFFITTQQCNVGGNIMSLLFNDDFEDKTDLTGYDTVFFSLFAGQPVVDASELILPATTLANECYWGMFRDCTLLTKVPALPATTLVYQCYGSMFRGCTSLVTAPALPATTLADNCYDSMFDKCSSLTTAPVLPATTLADRCYSDMFFDCTSLTTAPVLPATTLADNCYSSMFNGCTSLTTVPALPATTLSSWCYGSMFSRCTSLTTAPELPATTLSVSCYNNMFTDCTSLTTAPELPATTLSVGCYGYMFTRCTNLNYIKMLATDISANSCLYRWVRDVSSTGTFVKDTALSEATIGRGENGIPEGWNVVDAE